MILTLPLGVHKRNLDMLNNEQASDSESEPENHSKKHSKKGVSKVSTASPAPEEQKLEETPTEVVTEVSDKEDSIQMELDEDEADLAATFQAASDIEPDNDVGDNNGESNAIFSLHHPDILL